VRIDQVGAVSIVGRIKEIINAGGTSIHPSEVEEALKAHPAVLDCGVFGEEVGGLEYVCAAIVPRDPAARSGSAALTDDLLEHCRRELSAKMIPRRIVLVERIPRGALGKIARAELRVLVGVAPR
jgi:long-chain acyl-CoA synthetase